MVITDNRASPEPAAVLELIAAYELETDFVVAAGLGVELGEAPVGAIFREHPIECAMHRSRCLGIHVAAAPRVECR